MYEDMHNGDASEPTFHNFRGPEHRGRHIDFIFHRGNVHTLTCDIVKDHEGKMYPSDHYFLDATYAIE
jgi:endonuclease/exonuclease/phosphatase family metal-dependent hydrolase